MNENSTHSGQRVARHALFAFDFEAAIKTVALALEITNGCVATDDPDSEPDEKSWRIDHEEEIRMLSDLAEAVMNSALIPAPDLASVISSLRGGIDKAGEDLFRNATESVASPASEADDHAGSGGIVSDSGDCGGSDRDHVHSDDDSGEGSHANVEADKSP